MTTSRQTTANRRRNVTRPYSMEESLYIALREDIVHLNLPPRRRLHLVELAAEYGVSLTPVRHALSRLAGDGLVESAPNMGSWVAEISVEDLEVIETVGASVEVRLARLGVPNLISEDDDALRDLLTQRKKLVGSIHAQDLVHTAWSGRELVYRRADRPRLLAVALQWRKRRERYFHFIIEHSGTRGLDTKSYFVDFAKACLKRDADRAAELTAKNSEWALEVVAGILAKDPALAGQ